MKNKALIFLFVLSSYNGLLFSQDSNQPGNTSGIFNHLEASKGILKIQSLTDSIKILIPGIETGQDLYGKSRMYINVSPGVYPASFSWNTQTISDTFTIKEGYITYLMVDFINGKAESLIRVLKDDIRKGPGGKANVNATGNTSPGLPGGIDSTDLITFEKVVEPDVMPKFNGGNPAVEFRRYIARTLHYPEMAAGDDISGRVIIQFTVSSKGKVHDMVILSPPNPILDREAIRVVSSSPDWTPGYLEGKPVAVLFTFPINFIIDDHTYRSQRKGQHKKSE